MRQKDGFPKPYADLDTEAGRREFRRLLGDRPAEALADLSLGRLRATDPILGDLVVVMADARYAVLNRLIDLGLANLASEDPDA